MSHLEPTYLRYIHDSLVKGSIHPENAADLPDGLIGLYEEAFDERTSVVERQKLLNRFAIWALLKKEVNVAFVAEVLGESEDEIHDFISNYSAWFNSPESGKYQLYHERLKVYLLQKLSEGALHELHDKLILRLEHAIETQKSDEFEWYGLEFLVQHYSVNAMLNGNGSKLLVLAYNQNHWQRQLKISKGYIWTKLGLHSVMNWASKYNDDEVIECGLQLVDLYHKEQNAAPQIVAIVAEGDFDSALKRIDQFGGNDKEGLQRKFILYMLCLMELTLLDSKDKTFRKEGIEKFLKHMHEHLPEDHSILNLDDFFSSFLIFQMVCEWVTLNLDFKVVYKWANYNENDWIEKNGPYTEFQVSVLEKCANGNRDMAAISIELAKLGITDQALDFLERIDDCWLKSKTLIKISGVLEKLEKYEEASNFLNVALENARRMTNEEEKFTSLMLISYEYSKTENSKHWALIVANEAETTAKLISDDAGRIASLEKIALHLIELNEIVSAEFILLEAVENAKKIEVPFTKIKFLISLSAVLFEIGNHKEAELLFTEIFQFILKVEGHDNYGVSCELKFVAAEFERQGIISQTHFFWQKAIQYANKVEGNWLRDSALDDISIELSRLDKITESISVIESLDSEYDKSEVFVEIAIAYARRNLIPDCIEFILKIQSIKEKNRARKEISEILARKKQYIDSQEIASGIIDVVEKKSTLVQLAKIIAEHGEYEQALKMVCQINDTIERISLIRQIASSLFDVLKFERAYDLLIQSLEYKTRISDHQQRIALQNMCIQLCEKVNCHESLKLISIIGNEEDVEFVLKKIVKCLVEKKCVAELLASIEKINQWSRFEILHTLAVELAKQGKLRESYDVTKKIKNRKSKTLNEISLHLTKVGMFSESKKFVDEITSDINQSITFCEIAEELFRQGNFEQSNDLINRSFEISQYIDDDVSRIRVYCLISTCLYKMGKTKKCTELIQDITNQISKLNVSDDKSYLFIDVTKDLLKQGKIREAVDVFQNTDWKNKIHYLRRKFFEELIVQGYVYESLQILNYINNESVKCEAMGCIMLELAKLGNWQLAFDISANISDFNKKESVLRQLSSKLIVEKGYFEAEDIVKEIKIDEIKSKVLRYLINENLCFKTVDLDLCLSALKGNHHEYRVVFDVLQMYAFNQVFSENKIDEKIHRFNQTLDIQWAIDINNQLN